jgi:hypothetical protein
LATFADFTETYPKAILKPILEPIGAIAHNSISNPYNSPIHPNAIGARLPHLAPQAHLQPCVNEKEIRKK